MKRLLIIIPFLSGAIATAVAQTKPTAEEVRKDRARGIGNYGDYFQPGQNYSSPPTTGAAAVYQVKAGDEIQVKFAIYGTGIENARRNMDGECAGWDFDAVRKALQDVWDEYPGRIDVKGGTDAQQIKFYTDRWHVLPGRHKLDDLSGDYPDYYTGGTFKIKTRGNSATNCYIQKVALNGKPHDSFRFPHKDFASGGMLELWLEPEPDKTWGVK